MGRRESHGVQQEMSGGENLERTNHMQEHRLEPDQMDRNFTGKGFEHPGGQQV